MNAGMKKRRNPGSPEKEMKNNQIRGAGNDVPAPLLVLGKQFKRIV